MAKRFALSANGCLLHPPTAERGTARGEWYDSKYSAHARAGEAPKIVWLPAAANQDLRASVEKYCKNLQKTQ